MKCPAKWFGIVFAVALFAAGSVRAQGGAGLGDLDALLKPAVQPAPAPAAAPAAVPAAEAPAIVPAVAPAAVPAAEAPAVVPVAVPAVAPAAVPAAEAPAVVPVAVPAVAPAALPAAEAPAATPATNAAVDAAGKENLVSELMTLEKLRRNALREHGLASLAAARKALRDGDYEEAKKQFEMVLQYTPDSPETRPARDEAREGVREALYRNAILAWKKGDREKALQLARQANEKGHPDAGKLVTDIQKEIDNPPKPPPPRELARMSESAYKDERDETMAHLRRARQHYIVGEYDKSRLELEIILRDHPFNTEAMEMLKRIGDRTYDISVEEFEATRARMVRDVEDTWTPRRYAIDTVQIKDASSARANNARSLVAGGLTSEQAVEAKMKGIVLPEISFRNANINDVIQFFESSSREYDDPALPPDKRGVNFVLKIVGGGTAAPAAAPAATGGDIFAGATTDAGGSSAGGTPITFNARFVSLWEALKIVTEVAGYKFRVRGNVVMVMPSDMPDWELETRSYTVLPTLSDRLTSVSREMTAPKTGGGGTGGGFEGMNATADMSDRQDWKKFFEQLGVPWPKGSTISYLPTIGKLRVQNTPENLAIFETVLEELNVTPRQIEIEARFVEVEQSDLDSLGFDWWLNKAFTPLANHGAATDVTAPGPGGFGTVNTGGSILNGTGNGLGVGGGGGGTVVATVPYEVSSGLRYLTSGALPNVTAIDSVLNLHGIFDNIDVSAVLHMLSQRSNTDLLSAPKVVTKSGQEAVMKVVTEYIYPTTFTIIGGNVAANNVGGAVATPPGVEPGGFETREVGVILQVVPEVSAEGQMINLTMNPQVVSDPVWHDYGYDIPSQFAGQPPTHIPMQQPFFKVRSISTSVSIYNGATVVMGGMITENRNETEDKFPFLGDIPYLGQLFRSKASNTDKRNLLIFVTARLVDPAGRSLKMPSEPTLGGEKLKTLMIPAGTADARTNP